MVWAPPPGPNAAAGLVGGAATINYKNGNTYIPPTPPPPPMPAPPPPPVYWSNVSAQWGVRLSAMGSYHTNGANIALADGSIRFLSDSTALNVIYMLSTRAGGEVLPGNW
jgi:prepilin-type processing-associated H-X9-DG protein